MKTEDRCEEKSSSGIGFASSSVRLPRRIFRIAQVSSLLSKSLISVLSSFKFHSCSEGLIIHLKGSAKYTSNLIFSGVRDYLSDCVFRESLLFNP